MAGGALTAPAIATAAGPLKPLEITPLAALAVALHFGNEVDAAARACHFAFSNVDFEQLQSEIASPAMQQILNGLRSQQGGRTTLQVLQDSAWESKSAGHGVRIEPCIASLRRPVRGQRRAAVLLALLDPMAVRCVPAP